MTEMIHISVALSGRARELSLDPRLEYGLVPPARLGTLLELIGVKRPELGAVLAGCRYTINGQEVDQDTMLQDGDMVEIDSRG